MKKKTLFVAVAIFVCMSVFAQVVQIAQPFDFSNVSPGDSFEIVIRNDDTTPHSFYPLTVFDSPSNYLFVDEEHFFNYLHSPGTQMGGVRNMAHIIKSNRFKHGGYESEDFPNDWFDAELCNKKYSTIGWLLGQPFHHCGNFMRFATAALVRSGIFLPDSLYEVSMPGHTLAEGVVSDDTIAIDFDPNEPRFLDTLPNGTYMSTADIRDSSQYLYTQSPYVFCDPVSVYCARLSDDFATDRYVARFDSLVKWPLREIQPVVVSGIWTLPPKSSLTWTWKVPTYIIDTSDHQTGLLYDSISYLMTGTLNPPMDVVVPLAAQVLGGVSLNEASRVLYENDYVVADGTAVDPMSDRAFWQKNKLYFHLEPRQQVVVLGTDLAFPFEVSEILTNNPVEIGDTTYAAGTHSVSFYNHSLAGFGPVIEAKNFNYVQNGLIPANTSVDMVLYYNQLIYALMNGIKVESFGDNLAGITTTQHGPQMISGLSEKKEDHFVVFPNPATAVITIEGSFPGLDSWVLYNLSGQNVLQGSIHSSKTKLDISSLPSGVFLLKIGANTAKIIKI